MILKAIDKGLVQGDDFGGVGINISHLQFTDDTILFLKPKVEYLINVKKIMRCFKLASGLKINFHKSNIVRISKNKEVVDHSWAAVLRCKDGALLLSYLCLPLGSKLWSKAFWKALVEKIENRLAPWKQKYLSKGGRLTLMKVVVASNPTYYMSVSKMPKGIA